jgi:hypothetical protein
MPSGINIAQKFPVRVLSKYAEALGRRNADTQMKNAWGKCEEETYPMIIPSPNAKPLRIHTASLQTGQPGGGIF